MPLPRNIVITGLQARAIAHFSAGIAQGSLTYVFDIFRAGGSGNGVDVPASPYSSTGVSVNVGFPSTTTTTYPTGEYVASTTNTTTSTNIGFGSSIALRVSTNYSGTPPAVDRLSFQATMSFTY